ncbi:MAG: DUF4932 domain-containing protein [Bacteroidales bacterium]|jgi:hypothetical protein|nr:DUF4932 domain-containing protein [Bacteroidales bacterium]
MKKIITFIMILTANIAFAGSNLIPKVEQNTELVSIVFRLAGAREYVNYNVPSYEKEIDEYFAPYKEHPAVKFAQKVRSERGVAFDAVMSLAVHLNITDSVRLKDNIAASSIDERWDPKSIKNFVKLLNDFYFDTNFKNFFSKNKPLYEITEKRISEILNKVDFGWFGKFYGEQGKNYKFNLIPSIPNGGGNYGLKVIFKDGSEELYPVIGCCVADKSGLPSYSGKIVPVIVHEYNHSFCNPLIDAFYPSMKDATEKINGIVKNTLENIGYGDAKTMDYEILVRACVIMYSQRNEPDKEKLGHLVAQETSNGFIWIDQLVDSLFKYEKNRDLYPTLKDFMPEIVKLVNKIPEELKGTDFESRFPKILSVSIKDGSQNVLPGQRAITVTFDRPMYTKRHGTSYGKKGKDYFPEFDENKASEWDETKCKWTIHVILKPDKCYSLSFPYQFFMNEKGYHPNKTYYLDFKTKK